MKTVRENEITQCCRVDMGYSGPGANLYSVLETASSSLVVERLASEHKLFFFFCFDFLFYLGAHSSVITCSPMKPRAGMYQTV